MDAFDTYQTPLSRSVTSVFFVTVTDGFGSRYASKEMAHLFSPAVRSYE